MCVALCSLIIHLHHFLCSQNLMFIPFLWTTAHSPLRLSWVVTDLHDKSNNLIVKARRIQLKRAKTVHTVKVIIHRGSVLPHPSFCKKRVSCLQTWHESNLRKELLRAAGRLDLMLEWWELGDYFVCRERGYFCSNKIRDFILSLKTECIHFTAVVSNI